MSEIPKEIEQKIREMAKLTILSNRINDVQEKNLKMFPLICFEGIQSVRIDYDFSRARPAENEPDISASIVSYYLNIPQSPKMEDLEKRFEALEKCVRNIFWQDVKVEVYINDKIVYKSKKYGK